MEDAPRNRAFLPIAVLSTAALAVTAASAGCSPPAAVSFESLGLPEAAKLSDRAAVIFGWARDDRSGWRVDHVKIDGRDRPEWDEGSQRPTVFYLRPGSRKLRLYSARESSGSERSALRVRSRPVDMQVEPGQVLVCQVRLRGAEPPLPAVWCRASQPRDGSVVAARAGESTDDRVGRRRPTNSESTGQGVIPDEETDHINSGSLGQQLLERLGALEQRLERLESILTGALGSGCPEESQMRESRETRRPLRIDTTPPW